MNSNDWKLCYVRGCWAYFTPIDLDKQWGDDWDDAPYEHNAGEPYTNCKGVPHEIKRIAFDGPLQTPADLAGSNSAYSVEMINKGAAAWLTTDRWVKQQVSIPAGGSIERFIELVQLSGGKVYVPLETAK